MTEAAFLETVKSCSLSESASSHIQTSLPQTIIGRVTVEGGKSDIMVSIPFLKARDIAAHNAAHCLRRCPISDALQITTHAQIQINLARHDCTATDASAVNARDARDAFR